MKTKTKIRKIPLFILGVCVPIVMDSKDVGKVELKIVATKNEFIKKLDDILNMIKASSSMKEILDICGSIKMEIKIITDMNDAFTGNLESFNRKKYRSNLFEMHAKFMSISHLTQAITHTFGISGMKEIDLQILKIAGSIFLKSESESK